MSSLFYAEQSQMIAPLSTQYSIEKYKVSGTKDRVACKKKQMEFMLRDLIRKRLNPALDCHIGIALSRKYEFQK